MRILTEAEMRAAAGGMQPLTRPDPAPGHESPDHDIWLIRMQLWEPEIDAGSLV